MQRSPSVDAKIHNRDNNSGHSEQHRRDIRINELIKVVEKETALIGLVPRVSLKPILCPSEWARPRTHFNPYSPEK
jgi:hypothetical protein